MRETRPIRMGWRRRALGLGLGLGVLGLGVWRWTRQRWRPAPELPLVMILEPFGMGDILSLEPLVRLLNQRGYRVRLCAKTCWQSLIPGAHVEQWLPEKVPWTVYDEHRKYRMQVLRGPEFRSFCRQLQLACHGAVGIDCRGDIRSVALLHLAGCRRVLTLSHYLGSDLRMMVGAGLRVRDRGSQRRWELNLGFARCLGLDGGPDWAPPSVQHLLANGRTADPRKVGLIPVAPWDGRLWPAVKWRRLVSRLRQLGLVPAGCCGPGQEPLARQMLGEDVQIAVAQSVTDWVQVLSPLGLVVALDTGPMHLADAMGLPVVALFGSGRLPLWLPSGVHSVALHHQDRPGFYPCHQIQSNIALGQRYMDWIEVEEVEAAVRAHAPALASPSGLPLPSR